ncbi:RNA polymerase sigma factor [Hyunsoonleella rubra]|uniref:RNA polymerase sigma factor n=1 Tax=Hyunsoonleella rubra TaxID=1737062 RepID=A0ABW5TEI6_9FLAO
MAKYQNDIDRELILKFQSGDKTALNTLVKRWHKTFCEKAYWLVKDADVAKDIAQESWTVIINKINTLEKPESFGSWGLRIVCNKSMDWLNKKKRSQKHMEQMKHKEEILSSPDEGADIKEQLKVKLLEAINLLPPQQQIVIKLFYAEDYSLKEISKTLNISVGTTKSRLFHSREKLKQLLKQYRYEN